MTKTLSVSAIKNGTVIDHIRTGQALRIINFLRLLNDKHKVTVGLNLVSKSMGLKDLIKVEKRMLTPDEANQIVIFAPEATINIVQDFEVIEKLTTHLPPSIVEVFSCPNLACITHIEAVKSLFYIEERGKQMQLTCHFCEKIFDRDQVKVKI
jgi:aspartate carbamoyltransferase regulatory subunit